MADIPDEDAWDAWSPAALASRLDGVNRPWCVVGGWALDLWHRRVTREHHDLEFTVLRQDFDHFRRALLPAGSPLIRLPAPSPRNDGEKELVAPSALHLPRERGEGAGRRMRGERAVDENLIFYTVNSGLFEHLPDTAIPNRDIGQIWCWDTTASRWRVDMMIEPGTPDIWVCKRDQTITLPRARAVLHSAEGIPYLNPAAILLLKAKHRRPKDVADFEMALPKLDEKQRAWLGRSLSRIHPGHDWIGRL